MSDDESGVKTLASPAFENRLMGAGSRVLGVFVTAAAVRLDGSRGPAAPDSTR